MKNEMKNKIKVDIFIPAGACSCSFSKWIERVWDKLDPFLEIIDVETNDSNSEKAKKMKLIGQTILINDEITPTFKIKSRLEELSLEYRKK